MGVGCGPAPDRSYWRQQPPLIIPAEPDCAPEQPVSLLFSVEPEARGLYALLVESGVPPQVAATLEINQIVVERPLRQHYQATKALYRLDLRGFSAGAAHSVTLSEKRAGPVRPTAATRNRGVSDAGLHSGILAVARTQGGGERFG